jgi:uncharacterized protein (TIGR03435 family)
MIFAYKLILTPEQRDSLLAQFPRWTRSDRFTVEAQGSQSTTKNQIRVMTQALLADRFKLKIHFEIQDTPVLLMTLANPGKLGPKLIRHSAGPPCDQDIPLPAANEVPAVFPPRCDQTGDIFYDGKHPPMIGARNASIDFIGKSLPGPGRVSRPVVDQTHLIGTFDLTLTWAPDPDYLPSLPRDSPVFQGPTFFEAVKEQV